MNTQIYEEASEWVVRHRTEGLDAQSRRRFDDWLRQSPQHVGAYLEISSVWEGIPQIDATLNLGADQLIERARARSNVVPLSVSSESDPFLEPATKPTVERTRIFLSLAATLIVALGIAGWFYQQRDIYATDVGEQRTVTLVDGSVIELNARSRIKVRYDDRERGIDLLQGQALFRVARDSTKPFIVASGGTYVRAVGTQFDVYKKSVGTVVTVVEGRVAVTTPAAVALPEREAATDGRPAERGLEPAPAPPPAPDTSSRHVLKLNEGEVMLGAGEQLVVTQASSSSPQPADVDAVTAWRQQRLVFNDTPLPDVAEEFNRYNHRQLVIEDGELRTFRVSGSFSSTDPTLLLRFLRAQPGILVDERATEIRISRREVGVG